MGHGTSTRGRFEEGEAGLGNIVADTGACLEAGRRFSTSDWGRWGGGVSEILLMT